LLVHWEFLHPYIQRINGHLSTGLGVGLIIGLLLEVPLDVRSNWEVVYSSWAETAQIVSEAIKANNFINIMNIFNLISIYMSKKINLMK
jgi:site-specific recombinase